MLILCVVPQSISQCGISALYGIYGSLHMVFIRGPAASKYSIRERILTNLQANHIRGEWLYSVYNSQGQLMLYTRNRSWAEFIAQEFAQNPQTVEVIVHEQDPRIPKRT